MDAPPPASPPAPTPPGSPLPLPPQRRRLPWGRILPLAVIAALAIAAWTSGLQHEFSLSMLQMRGEAFRAVVQLHPVLTSLAFIGADIAAVLILLPVVAMMTLLSGFLFGTLWGGLLVMIGASTGSTLLFLIARSSFGEPLRARAHGLYARAAERMEEDAASYLLFIRLIPVLPSSLINIIPALFDIRLRTFYWTTLLGIIPVTFIYANFGQALGTIRHVHDLFSPGLALALTLLALLALVPIALKRLKR